MIARSQSWIVHSRNFAFLNYRKGAENILVKLLDDIHAPVNSQRPAIEREVVVLGVSPLHISIEPVVGCPALILVPNPLLRGLLPPRRIP